MAFKATINSINPQPDGTGTGVNWLVVVTFTDDATSFTSEKTYSFPTSTTQAAATAQITGDGNTLKSALGTLSNLQSKVGTVITI